MREPSLYFDFIKYSLFLKYTFFHYMTLDHLNGECDLPTWKGFIPWFKIMIISIIIICSPLPLLGEDLSKHASIRLYFGQSSIFLLISSIINHHLNHFFHHPTHFSHFIHPSPPWLSLQPFIFSGVSFKHTFRPSIAISLSLLSILDQPHLSYFSFTYFVFYFSPLCIKNKELFISFLHFSLNFIAGINYLRI